jgi:hypothetical protein
MFQSKGKTRTLVRLLVVLLALAAALAAVPLLAHDDGPPSDEDAEAIIAHINDLAEAWAVGDADVADALFAPGFIHVDIFGTRNDRATLLEAAATEFEFVEEMVPSNIELISLDVDTVLAIVDLDIHLTFDGESDLFALTTSMIFHRDESAWQIVAVHESARSDEEDFDDALFDDDDVDEADDDFADARTAGPAAITADATILGWPEDEGGDFVVLSEGSEEWYCIVDDPNTEPVDPGCFDATWRSFVGALFTDGEPTVDRIGIAYFLLGSSVPVFDEENEDQGPTWVEIGPHIALIEPGAFADFDLDAAPGSGRPFLILAGTPFAHLFIPVTSDFDDSPGADDLIDAGDGGDDGDDRAGADDDAVGDDNGEGGDDDTGDDDDAGNDDGDAEDGDDSSSGSSRGDY